MISRYERHGLVWIDLKSPTIEESTHLVEEFGLEDIKSSFRTVDFDNDKKLSFFIGPKFLITSRDHDIEAIAVFAKAFEKESLVDRISDTRDNGEYIFAQIMSALHNKSLKELRDLQEANQHIKRQSMVHHRLASKIMMFAIVVLLVSVAIIIYAFI